MKTANYLKTFVLTMGIALIQIALFVSYTMNVWHSPLALLIMVFIPVVMLVRTYQQERNWFKKASQTIGQIIDRRVRFVWGKFMKRLTIEYVLNGVTYKHYSYFSVFATLPAPGESYTLFYNPSKPSEARERGTLLGLMLPWIALSVCAIMLAFIAFTIFTAPDSLPVSSANIK
ncbi:hypothetical protein IC229_19185 [Spirosoma sp. BT702]|uniref:DUF3592 domain-containing protein n=1 Tax=Spirosoma profusum TaxID=2771354 RepID=A0A927AT73_9BACT|nr:hypothetical protein [Spirosoma profusum]MBD2702780.1 hypothetical protein [Spirosoma profusum]